MVLCNPSPLGAFFGALGEKAPEIAKHEAPKWL